MSLSRIKSFLVFAALSILMFNSASARAAATDAPVNTPADAKPFSENYFCMHDHDKPGYETAFANAPFAVFRTWDSGAVWPTIEPRKGEFDWKLLDSYAALARAKGAKIIFTIGMSPKWAAKNPDAPSPYSNLGSSPPADLDDWRNFVRAIAERNEKVYGGAIRYWEIWNEPDNIVRGYEFYTGTIGELVELARAAREILKQVNPENMIVSPGITQVGQRWLGDFLSQGGAQVVDIIGVHFYWDWYATSVSDFKVTMDGVRKAMAENGCADKPLWVTETGFSVSRYKTAGERDMALALTVIAPRFTGADVCCAYAWNNGMFTTMYDIDAGRETAVAGAYRELHKWLAGATIKDLGRGKGKSTVCEIERGGRHARIVWRNAPGTADFDAGEGGGLHAYRLDGTSVSVAADGKVRIGASPVLIGDSDYLNDTK